MESAEDRDGGSRRLRAFLPLMICFGLVAVVLGCLYHASQTRQAQIAFAVSVEGEPAAFYSAKLNGKAYQSGEPSGVGSKTVTIEIPGAEPFQTNVFTWYSGT